MESGAAGNAGGGYSLIELVRDKNVPPTTGENFRINGRPDILVGRNFSFMFFRTVIGFFWFFW